MKVKRGLALVLAAVMACTALPACSRSKAGSSSAAGAASGSGESKEPWTLEFTIPGAKDSISTDNDIGKELRKKFGVTIKIIGYSGDWKGHTAQMLAAGNYPEMMMLQDNDIYKSYVKAGALQDIGELAKKYAPNLLNFYKDEIPYWKYITGDGKFYKWCANSPDVEQATTPRFDMIVRSDILEEQNWPKLLNEDSYIKLLKRGLAAHPKTDGNSTLGMVMAAGEDWVLGDYMYELYAHGRYPEGSGILTWDTVDKKLVDTVLDTTNFKESIRFWNRLYREKILDPECFTDEDSVVQQKLSSARALSTFYVTWKIPDINKNLHKLGKDNMKYVTMPIMLQSMIDGKQNRIAQITDSYDHQSIVITKNCKNPQRIMEMVNWVCTQEGQDLLGWGIKGKHYTVDSKGIKTPTKEYIACANGTGSDPHFNDGISTDIFYFFLGLSSGFDKNNQCYNVQHDESVQNASMDDRVKDVYSHYGWTSIMDPWKKNSAFQFVTVHNGEFLSTSLDASDPVKQTENRLIEYKRKSMAKLIMSVSYDAFEANWADFIKGYKMLNPDSVKKAYSDGLKATQAKIQSYRTA